MRKSILMFIAATLVSSASIPVPAVGGELCGVKRNQCHAHCNRHNWYGNLKAVCLGSCDKAHTQCKIRKSVMIPDGGVLGNGGAVLSGQDPSATGSPLGGGRAPSAPPIIIR
jgi:hypothetical protein